MENTEQYMPKIITTLLIHLFTYCVNALAIQSLTRNSQQKGIFAQNPYKADVIFLYRLRTMDSRLREPKTHNF